MGGEWGRRAIPLEEAKRRFAEQQCEFLDNFYVNMKHRHNYRCSCGNITLGRLQDIERGGRCLQCKGRLTYQEVITRCTSLGLVFLDRTYIDYTFKHNFACLECGKPTIYSLENLTICFNLHRTIICPACKEHKTPNSRDMTGYAKWKGIVRLRDGDQCILCGSQNLLHVHHLNNWVDFPEQRLLIDNGITICESDHTDFHSKYGKSCIRSQFEEFYELYNN